MPTGKNTDDVVELIRVTLEHEGVAPTPRLVEAIRRVVVQIAAEEKSRITDALVRKYLIQIGLLKS